MLAAALKPYDEDNAEVLADLIQDHLVIAVKMFGCISVLREKVRK